jgi:hypothetical protein
LRLHGVHAGRSSHALLIQLDRSWIFAAFVNQPNRLNQLVFETVLERLDDIAILDRFHGSLLNKRAGTLPARPDLSGR